VSEVRLAYANSALRKGDYDLGASLLDGTNPTHAALRRQIMEAQREREARQQRLKVMKRAAVGLIATVLLVVTVAFFWIKSARDEAILAEAEAVQRREEAVAAKSGADKRREEAEAAQKQEIIAKNKAI